MLIQFHDHRMTLNTALFSFVTTSYMPRVGGTDYRWHWKVLVCHTVDYTVDCDMVL